MAVTTVSSVPPRIDVVVLAGQRLELSVPVLGGDGLPVEAAAMVSARAQLRKRVGSADVLHEFSTADDTAEITGGATGAVVLTATAEDTTSWQTEWAGQPPRTVAWWDLEVTDTVGEVHQITSPGTFTLVHQVTR